MITFLKRLKSQRCAIYYCNEEFRLFIKDDGGKIQQETIKATLNDNEKKFAQAVASIVPKKSLCHIILPPNSYQFSVMASPQGAESLVLASITDQLRNVLPYEIQRAILVAQPNPLIADQYNVLTCQQKYLKSLQKAFISQSLLIPRVSIMEHLLSTIPRYLNQKTKQVDLLFFRSNNILQLAMCYDGFYLSNYLLPSNDINHDTEMQTYLFINQITQQIELYKRMGTKIGDLYILSFNQPEFFSKAKDFLKDLKIPIINTDDLISNHQLMQKTELSQPEDLSALIEVNYEDKD